MSVLIAGLSSLSLLLGCNGDQDRCDRVKTWVEGEELHIVGLLNEHAHYEIIQQLNVHPEVNTLVLDNIEGTINAVGTLRTAALVHKRGLNTHVPKDGFIESGGVDLFCGGKERTAVLGAHIGVHSWWTNDGVNGADLPLNHDEHRAQRAYFDDIGCPASFYEYTLNAADGSSMYVMKKEDLIKEGVVTRFVKAVPKGR